MKVVALINLLLGGVPDLYKDIIVKSKDGFTTDVGLLIDDDKNVRIVTIKEYPNAISWSKWND